MSLQSTLHVLLENVLASLACQRTLVANQKEKNVHEKYQQIEEKTPRESFSFLLPRSLLLLPTLRLQHMLTEHLLHPPFLLLDPFDAIRVHFCPRRQAVVHILPRIRSPRKVHHI